MVALPTGALMRAASCSLGGLLLLSGCSGADDDPIGESSEARTSVAVDVRDVVCPGAAPAASVSFSGLSGAADFEAYLLDDEKDLGEDYSGTYCLQVTDHETFGSAPTKLTIEAEGDPENYAESYTLSDPAGDDDLMNFPFSIGVYGECRPVSATLTLADGQVHAARMRIGTGCQDT